MEIKEMAEAHLRNVQQQIQELEQRKAQIDEDIQKLSQYLQQGVAELNAESNVPVPETPSTPRMELPSMGADLGEG